MQKVLISKSLNNADGILNYPRKNGDFPGYNPATNEFAVITKDGAIRTYFKPQRRDGLLDKREWREINYDESYKR